MSIKATKWAMGVLPVLDVSPTDKLALLCLAYHHNDKTGECFPSMQTLASECGVTSRRIQQAVGNLVDWSVIRKKRGGAAAGNASNKYTLFGSPKRPNETGKRVPVRSGFKPEQKSTFETGNRVPVSNRKPCSDDRGYYSEDEKTHASGLKIIGGGRDA